MNRELQQVLLEAMKNCFGDGEVEDGLLIAERMNEMELHATRELSKISDGGTGMDFNPPQRGRELTEQEHRTFTEIEDDVRNEEGTPPALRMPRGSSKVHLGGKSLEEPAHVG